MSGANDANIGGSPVGDGNISPDPQIGLHITNEEVDDALNFDLDFDQMAETMSGALPDINLDDMGSLGTRSPSPSASTSGSVFSKGSKRSRAEFDSESDCNSDRHEKRMVYHAEFPASQTASGLELNVDKLPQQQQPQPKHKKERNESPSKVIRRDREREGRCPDCGLDTHRVFKTDNGFELEPLSIEGEVLDGRCLLCNPLNEDEAADQNHIDDEQKGAFKAGKANSHERPTSKNMGEGKKENNDPERGSVTTRPPSRANSAPGGPSHTKISPYQQRQKMRNTAKKSPPHPGNQLPFHSSGRDQSRRSSTGSHVDGRFSTSTPSQYHSRMALLMQSKLPRKHSAMQHAQMVFGNTNNRKGGGGRPKGLSRRSSAGSGAGNKQTGNNDRTGGSGGKPGPPASSGGSGIFQRAQHDSSNASLSSVSCSEVESTLHNHENADDRSSFSKSSHLSQSSLQGLGKAMAMGMGMSCTETASADPSQPLQGPRSTDPPTQPQTPHQNRRTPSDPPLSRSSSSISQTPQSVPANKNNILANRMMMKAPQSVPPNMSNSMSSRLGTGGGNQNQQKTSEVDITKMSNSVQNDNIMGNVPPAIRLAHSKLSSSIYHHHAYPLPEEMERAHVEKTLSYLESGSGDISDIIVAMRRFPFSLAVQRASTDKLRAHCYDSEHAHAIGLVGGIRTVIDAMEHHPEDVALQRGCAGVIKHLAGASAYNLEMLDKMGAVGIVVGAMERHPNSAALLEACCWALEGMSRGGGQDVKMRVAKGGGIHAAMKAVEVFPNNESLLRAAFHCLRHLGYNPANYSNQGSGQGQGGQQHFQLQNQQMQKLEQFHKQQQQRQSNLQQHHQQQQKHRSGGGSSHRASSGGVVRGSGMSMMPTNMMMGKSMMGNNMGSANTGMNNPMMGNMMNSASMMSMGSMGSNMNNMGNMGGMNMNMGGMNMNMNMGSNNRRM